MILFLILTLIVLILVTVIVLVVSTVGAAGVIIFGDVIVCIFIIVGIMRLLFKKKRK